MTDVKEYEYYIIRPTGLNMAAVTESEEKFIRASCYVIKSSIHKHFDCLTYV